MKQDQTATTHQIALEETGDTELVRLAQDGHDPAFEELIGRYRARLFKTAMNILRNPEDAEDELQNAVWNAYRYIGGFERNAQFSTWITRILLNQCLMRLRKERRHRSQSIDNFEMGGETATLDLRDERPSQEQELSQSEMDTVLRKEVSLLPKLLRQVLLLVHIEELPVADAAARLGITVPAAKSRVLRARQELRRRMETHLLRPNLVAG